MIASTFWKKTIHGAISCDQPTRFDSSSCSRKLPAVWMNFFGTIGARSRVRAVPPPAAQPPELPSNGQDDPFARNVVDHLATPLHRREDSLPVPGTADTPHPQQRAYDRNLAERHLAQRAIKALR